MKNLSKDEKLAFIKLAQTMLRQCTNQFNDDVSFFIACQFALESDFGRSDLAITCNNISGMRHPLVRLTSSFKANKNGFACYSKIYDCIFDYLLCLNYYQIGVKECESVSCFSRFISKWYCPTKDYIKRIDSIYNEYKQFSNYQSKLNCYVNDNEK